MQLFWAKSLGANYGFLGGQLQNNLLNDLESNWAAAGRMSFTSILRPRDME